MILNNLAGKYLSVVNFIFLSFFFVFNCENFLDNYPTLESVIPLLVENLKCTPIAAQKLVLEQEEKFNLLTFSELTKQLKMFLDHGIDKDVLLKYPEIIFMNPKMTKTKLKHIKELPVGEKGANLTDYLPLMRMSLENLTNLKMKLINERRQVPGGSRIHFLSEKFSIEPYLVSAVFSNYLFMARIPMRLIYSNTDVLLEYNVPAAKILKDPWIFLYSTRRARLRLSQAQKIKSDKLMPWMVHCDSTKLDHSLKIASDMQAAHREVDSEDVLGYISKRLGYERSEMEIYMSRFPPALKVRVTKIKSIIDFLLNEAGYKPIQIAAVPRILTFGLKQMKERHAQLTELGYTATSLIVFCFTRTKFSELLERIKRHRFYRKRNKKSEVTAE